MHEAKQTRQGSTEKREGGGKKKITPPIRPFAACRTLLYKKHQLPPCPKGRERAGAPAFLEAGPAFPRTRTGLFIYLRGAQ